MPDTADSTRPRLLADIGGTNARFAWQDGAGAPIVDARVLRCADHASLAAAVERYLADAGRAAPPDCAIAVAAPVVGDRVDLTNHRWAFSIGGLKATFGFARLRVLNDFTALALALPALDAAELHQVGGGDAAPDAAIGLIGPGTGLGVSGLLPDGRGGWSAIEGEGGHVTLAGRTPREQAVLDWLAALHGHASAERAVCGQGLVDVHRALCALDGAAEPDGALQGADIVAAALAGEDARAAECVDLFCAFLGTAAGNLALTLGARGGVYVGGGIVPRLGARFDRSPFRERFDAKGRFAGYLARIPVFVIRAGTSPALLGASRALQGG